MQLAGITTLEEANAVLPTLIARHNARFRQPAAQPGSAYRRLPAGKRPDDVFCFRYWRTVSMDNVVRLEGRVIPIPPGPQRRSYARARVEVREHLDGSASVHYQGICIARQGPQSTADLRTKRRGKAGERPVIAAVGVGKSATPVQPKTPPLESTVVDFSAPKRPAPDHPWRRSLVKAQRTFSQNS